MCYPKLFLYKQVIEDIFLYINILSKIFLIYKTVIQFIFTAKGVSQQFFLHENILSNTFYIQTRECLSKTFVDIKLLLNSFFYKQMCYPTNFL